MRRPLSLTLILCLALTGIGLGAARGTVLLGGQVVLCTGAGVVVVDHPDAPRQTHLCPDMALSLLAATAVVPPGFGPAETMARPVVQSVPSRPQGRESPRPAARDPPVGQSSAPNPV
ncbi:hypothetical protein [uncultured Paracoccus sp.]|uniref:hypothetical protein n=1 Tax=uncultured Paracoccus sp. TaxID=189685 RepID=UPI0025EF55B5|nr:hypothetical protein [uncultured Paracoccus sp.]